MSSDMRCDEAEAEAEAEDADDEEEGLSLFFFSFGASTEEAERAEALPPLSLLLAPPLAVAVLALLAEEV